MKKAVSIIIVLSIMLTAFFFSPVFGAVTTTLPQYIGEVHNRKTSSSVSFEYKATMLTPVIGEEIVNVSSTPGLHVFDSYVPVYVTLKVYNGGTVNKAINYPDIALYVDYQSNFPNGYGVPQGIKEIINYSPDLMLSYDYSDTTGSFMCVPSADWSNGNKLILLPGQAICLIAEVRYNAYYITGSSYEIRYPTLNSIGGTPTVANTTLNPPAVMNGGSSTDYSTMLQSVIDVLDNIDDTTTDISSFVDTVESVLNDIEANTDDLETQLQSIYGSVDGVESLLTNIRALLTWVGAFPTVSYSNLQRNDFNGSVSEEPAVTYLVERTYSGGYPIMDSTDFEPPDDIYQNILYKHTFVYYIVINNTSGEDIVHTGRYYLNGFMPSTYRGVELSGWYSSTFKDPYIAINNNTTYLNFYLDEYDPVLRNGSHRAVAYISVYTLSPTRPTLNNPTISVGGGNDTFEDELSEESSNLKDKSDQVHTMEEAYYTQNREAIEQTGLANYRFTPATGNGILAVSNDFTDIWNSLGSWTRIYIFSMTLGLALTIIRHAPNAISRTMRRKANSKEE